AELVRQVRAVFLQSGLHRSENGQLLQGRDREFEIRVTQSGANRIVADGKNGQIIRLVLDPAFVFQVADTGLNRVWRMAARRDDRDRALSGAGVSEKSPRGRLPLFRRARRHGLLYITQKMLLGIRLELVVRDV